MSVLVKIIVGIVLAVLIAFGAGVRIHPEIFSSGPTVQKMSVKRVQLNLKNGQSMTGQLVSQTPSGIVFEVDGASISFAENEIRSMSEIEAASEPAASAGGSAWRSFVTYDPKLCVLNYLPIAQSEPAKKPKVNAGALWGARPVKVAPAASSKAAASGTAKQDPNSFMGIYEKSMSPEALESWKNSTVAQLNEGRNPFVEARNAKRDAEAKDEARQKKLEEMLGS